MPVPERWTVAVVQENGTSDVGEGPTHKDALQALRNALFERGLKDNAKVSSTAAVLRQLEAEDKP